MTRIQLITLDIVHMFMRSHPSSGYYSVEGIHKATEHINDSTYDETYRAIIMLVASGFLKYSGKGNDDYHPVFWDTIPKFIWDGVENILPAS